MVTSLVNIHETIDLPSEIESLLSNLGPGRTDGVPYDTAWTARLIPHYPGRGFEAALDWLRQHQYEDGSWGAPLVHYHDRFVSTLAAIIALKEVGDSYDRRRVKRGEDALWKLVGRLATDDSDTIGFPVLSVGLTEEASALGLDVPRPPVRFAAPYWKKVNALVNLPNRPWTTNPLTFSLEGLRSVVTAEDQVLEPNDSVSTSPAATASYLLQYEHEGALNYLQRNMEAEGTGAVSHVVPIDIFEIAWTLQHLRRAQAITPDDPEVRKLLDRLWAAWSPDVGVSYSTYFSVPDIDVTAACFLVLRWGGYPVDASVFAYYELDDHFCCYRGETNPSMSAHVRLLAALRQDEDHPQVPAWIEKILRAIQRWDGNGSYWWDKWHASPYYVTAAGLRNLRGIADALATSRLKWMLRTQNDDGGWGYLGTSTPEETAYCLEALLQWDREVERISPDVLDHAAGYLLGHVGDTRFTPLWIGKSLYTPHFPVKAAILSSLFSYSRDRS